MRSPISINPWTTHVASLSTHTNMYILVLHSSRRFVSLVIDPSNCQRKYNHHKRLRTITIKVSESTIITVNVKILCIVIVQVNQCFIPLLSPNIQIKTTLVTKHLTRNHFATMVMVKSKHKLSHGDNLTFIVA